MEIYNSSGALKSGTLRVTQSIGALGFSMSQALHSITNEVITIYIERSRGENEYIADKIPLASVLMTSAFGEGDITDWDNEIRCLIELSENGGVNLEDNERIVIVLDSLKSTVTYKLHGIQYPVRSNDLVSFERKIMLANELKRTFSVQDADEMAIIGLIDKIVLTYDTDTGREVVEHTYEEVKYLMEDMGGFTHPCALTDGNEVYWDQLVVNIVGVEKVEVHSSNQAELIIRTA